MVNRAARVSEREDPVQVVFGDLLASSVSGLAYRQSRIYQFVTKAIRIGPLVFLSATPRPKRKEWSTGIHIRAIARFCTPLKMVSTTSSAYRHGCQTGSSSQ